MNIYNKIDNPRFNYNVMQVYFEKKIPYVCVSYINLRN